VAAAEEGGGVTPAVLAVLLVAGFAGGAAAYLLARRRRPGAAPAQPLLAALGPTAAPALPPVVRATGDRREPAAPRLRPVDPPARDPGGAGPPPDRTVAWTAEIEWRDAEGSGRFRVVARATDGRSAVVGRSRALDWPPSGPEAGQALSAAVDRLEAGLTGAGWGKLAPGTAWYARRFGWEPTPAAVGPRASAPSGSGRFKRPAWPQGTEERWRCEITWRAGYVSSCFEATAYAPGQHRGEPIGASERFKWLLADEPDPARSDHLREARKLAAALRATGWERLARGPKWYAERYVWPGDGPPPGRLEPARATKGGSP
jgi:hypothetical protein